MLKNFIPRLYQETILATAAIKNTLVVLPTGMGKTAISMLLACQRFKQYPNSKVLILSPTRPLALQHLATFTQFMDEPGMTVFTGMTSPEKRQELWTGSRIIFSTPQGLENDIISNRISLEDVSLIVFDEAHRATGDYSYVFIASQYSKRAKYPRILALTASPGTEMEKIKEVMKNLFIEDLEIRTEDDPDVKPYVKEIHVDYIKVALTPPFQDVQKLLKEFVKDRMMKLKNYGVLRKDINFVNRKDLIVLQGELRAKAGTDFVMWTAISVLAEIMKVSHALELLESQGIYALHEYLARLQKDGIGGKTKAIKNIVCDPNFKAAVIKTESMFSQGFQHPKLIELQKLLEKEKTSKIIIFNQYRDNASNIVDILNKQGFLSKLFVGQQKKGESGLSQKEQKEILDEFRKGLFNILVATSVGEEGLDIPQVDLVIFFEPIPSAIRQIQRRGRTGRQEKGRVIIFVAENTRDEAYRWSAHHKEKKMHLNLAQLKKGIKIERPAQELMSYSKPSVKIYADHREKSSGALKELVDLNADIKMEQLSSADYILSERCGVEFKTAEDFAASIIDGRLLEQAKGMKNNFDRPLIIIEGEEEISRTRNIHPNAIRGMLATLAVSFGIPVMLTKNPKETASLLFMIAKKEQEGAKDFSMHADRKPLSERELQEYIISSFPNVGPSIAKELLRQFGTIRKIMTSEKESLKKVDKVGEKTADGITFILDKTYE